MSNAPKKPYLHPEGCYCEPCQAYRDAEMDSGERAEQQLMACTTLAEMAALLLCNCRSAPKALCEGPGGHGCDAACSATLGHFWKIARSGRLTGEPPQRPTLTMTEKSA